VSLLQVDRLKLCQRERTLVAQLCLQIEAGQCWVVLGRNGSGKSTLLRALAGLAPPDGGQILWNGRALDGLPPVKRAQRLGLVFQRSHAGFHNTTLEMALSGNYPHRAGWGYENTHEMEQALQALQAVDLHQLADAPLESLSGGELRRAEIARLLMQMPRLAMLDEPLNHLDTGQQIAMLRLLRERFCTNRRALVMVLHDINLARRVASHLLLLGGDGGWQALDADLVDVDTLGELLGYPLHRSITSQGEVLEIDYQQAGLAPPTRQG